MLLSFLKTTVPPYCHSFFMSFSNLYVPQFFSCIFPSLYEAFSLFSLLKTIVFFCLSSFTFLLPFFHCSSLIVLFSLSFLSCILPNWCNTSLSSILFWGLCRAEMIFKLFSTLIYPCENKLFQSLKCCSSCVASPTAVKLPEHTWLWHCAVLCLGSWLRARKRLE